MTRDEAHAVVKVVLGFDFDGHPQDGPEDMLCALREAFPDQPWGELAREIDPDVDLEYYDRGGTMPLLDPRRHR